MVERKKLTREQVVQIVREAKERREKPNLSRTDLREVDLRGLDLTGAYLTEAYLTGAFLIRVLLSGANLNRAHLDVAYLSVADLDGADLSYANLSGADLREANLAGANLNRAYLRRANLVKANLSRANLRGTDLSYVDLIEANLSQADLSGADLSGAKVFSTDLTTANLSGANLMGTDLHSAKLSEANFSEADLSKADLAFTDLTKAELTKADLTGATLVGAHLVEANLSETNLFLANLRDANLKDANLRGANLIGAQLKELFLDNTNFSNAILNETSFIKIDLSQAKGLTSVQHKGPSIIDINTIFQSKDKIPEVFLKGAGVEDAIIRWQHSLHTRPTVFICYSPKDKKEKDELLEYLSVLENNNFITIWHNDLIQPGADWKQETEKAIDQVRVAILFVTVSFLNSKSILDEQIPKLLKRQNEEKLVIFPIIAKECPWRQVDWLAKMKVRPQDEEPIWSKRPDKDIGHELTTITKEVADTIIYGWF